MPAQAWFLPNALLPLTFQSSKKLRLSADAKVETESEGTEREVTTVAP